MRKRHKGYKRHMHSSDRVINIRYNAVSAGAMSTGEISYTTMFQTALLSMPSSLFIPGLFLWISNASRIFLSNLPFAPLITLQVCQSISCGSSSLCTCSATADFSVCPRRMAFSCSFFVPSKLVAFHPRIPYHTSYT